MTDPTVAPRQGDEGATYAWIRVAPEFERAAAMTRNARERALLLERVRTCELEIQPQTNRVSNN